MTSLKRLLSNGKALWLAAVVAVACSPSAAAVLAGDDRFVDDHASAMAADVATAGTADLIAGIEDTAVAEGRSTQSTKASDAVEQPATVAVNDASVEPAVIVITNHVVTAPTIAQNTPAPKPTATPSTAPLTATSSLAISELGAATLTVDTAPHVTCAITVSSAGRVPGLDAKQSDAAGHIVWTWAVATVPMNGAARVECTSASQSLVVTTSLDAAAEAAHSSQSQQTGNASGAGNSANAGGLEKAADHRPAAPRR